MNDEIPSIFVISKKEAYPCLEGPMTEHEYEEKVEADHFGLDALVKHKKAPHWNTLHGGTWMMELLPSDWLESRFKNITALCSENTPLATLWTVQFEGSKTGPIPASEIPFLNPAEIKEKALFIRATEWQEWVKVTSKEWFLDLFNEGKLLSSNPRPLPILTPVASPPKEEARGAVRHKLLGTVWWAKVNGSNNAIGSCVDLSTSGAQILFDLSNEYRVGDELTISFCPTKITSINDLDNSLIELKSTIVWYSVETQRFGLKFIDLNPTDIAKLQMITRNFSE